jgi:type IV pilus assembly protein PilX
MATVNIPGSTASPSFLGNQRGVSLVASLMVLAVMMLAAVGLARTINATTLISGNMMFKQAAINASDIGAQKAFDWLQLRGGSTVLNLTATTTGYYSAQPPTEPDWKDSTTWATAQQMTDSATGSNIAFLIYRMCTQPDTPYNGDNGGVPNQCAVRTVSGIAAGGASNNVGAVVFGNASQLYYRVVIRVIGPRGTTFTDTFVAISA